MEQVGEFFIELFKVNDWPARWVCGHWTSFHGWLYILSDLSIFGAYFAIPVILFRFVKKRKDLPFLPIFWLFAAFILFCGSTHLIDAISFWWPAYRLNALARFGTAAVSWLTVFALIKIIPDALKLKSPKELEETIESQTSALAKSNQDLQQFSYTLSHDLKVPLHATMLNSDLLKYDYEEKLDEEGREIVSNIQENVNTMAQMVDEMLEYFKADMREVKFEEIDMEAKFRKVLKPLLSSEKKRKVDIEIKHLPPCYGDRKLLRSIISNLLSNALKYTREQDVTKIEIGCKTVNGKDTYYVKDNGTGFDPKHKKDIFELFKRYSRKTPGTGLGLAIVKKLIEQQGGSVWADSTPGKGATFYFQPPSRQEVAFIQSFYKGRSNY